MWAKPRHMFVGIPQSVIVLPEQKDFGWIWKRALVPDLEGEL